MNPTQCGVAGYIIYLLGVRIGTRALTYLLTYTAPAYEPGNISETVEDRGESYY